MLSLVKKIIVIGIITFVTTGIKAQTNNKSLAVYAEAIIFNNPEYDTVSLVEFPFTLNRDEFQFYRPDSTSKELFARIFAQVNLMNTEGRVIDSVRTYFSAKVSSSLEANKKDIQLFNKLSLMVKPGIYTARLKVLDVVSKKEGTYFLDKIIVNPIEKQKISIGGICLAYNMEYVGDDSSKIDPLLNENGFKILINPVNIFPAKDTIIYLYGEIYNLKYSPEEPSKYQLSIAALDNIGNIYNNFGSVINDKPGKSCVIAEDLDVKDWSLGNYKLQISALDLTTNEADTVYIPFHIISTKALLMYAKANMNMYDPYDSLSFKDKTHLVKYLLDDKQKQIFSNLSDSGKIHFLDQYWKEHDINPATHVIENRIQMINRYRFVNRMFSTNSKKNNGWATDRGRIYMTYGPWDERDDFQAPRIGNPYVVWYYRSVREGKLFIFEDWTGNGDYRLVHSNVYGEVYSQEWQDRIDQGYIDIYEKH